MKFLPVEFKPYVCGFDKIEGKESILEICPKCTTLFDDLSCAQVSNVDVEYQLQPSKSCFLVVSSPMVQQQSVQVKKLKSARATSA